MVEFENYKEPEYNINNSRDFIIGRNGIMIELFYYLNHLAKLPTTILIEGETGTGKELFAKALHYNGLDSGRKNNFVVMDCAKNTSPDLLASELFGYVKGAFTGAHIDRKGRFEYADGGTIFLDEIGNMDQNLQSKFLRILQEKQFTKIGSNIMQEVNVRVIAATNKNLEKEVNNGNFREDLYYRLNVFPVKIPPLRDRKADIPLIAEYFIKKFNGKYNVELEGLSYDAKEKLELAEWKGNVRELENILERAFILTMVKKGEIIDADDLFVNRNAKTNGDGFVSLNELERSYIMKVLEHTSSNRLKASKILDIHYQTLAYKMNRYGIPKCDARKRRHPVLKN